MDINHQFSFPYFTITCKYWKYFCTNLKNIGSDPYDKTQRKWVQPKCITYVLRILRVGASSRRYGQLECIVCFGFRYHNTGDGLNFRSSLKIIGSH